MAGMRAVGLDAVANQLRAAAGRIGDQTAANTDVARFVADRARPRLPHASGALAASVTSHGEATKAVVSVGVRYARPVLFGAPRAGTPAARVTVYTVALDQLPNYLSIYQSAAADACALVKG